jgi:hypothetical protein
VRTRIGALAFPAALAAALLPLAVAAWRACGDDLYPLSDHAYIALRAHDVGTAHQPLVGAWTSAASGRPPGLTFNNLGPLHYVFLAPWVRLLGPVCGLPAGAAALNALAVVTVGWAARRRAGATGGLLALAVATALAWSMGDALLADAWQPYQVMLPTLAALVCAWAVADGDRWCLPVFAAWASVVAQTHLSFVYLLALTGGAAVTWAAVAARREVFAPGSLAASVAVTAVAWAPPLVEELRPGRGNLSRLWIALGDQAGTPLVGLARSARIVAAVAALPPFWGRPSLTETFQPVGVPTAGLGPAFGDPPGSAVTTVGLAVLAGALGVAAWSAGRSGERRDPTGVRAALFGGFVLAATILAVSRLPIGRPFGLSGHMVRAAWPAAAFLAFAILLGPLRRLGNTHPVFVAAPAALLAGLAAITVAPGPRGPLVPRLADAPAEATVRRALDRLRSRDLGHRTLRVQTVVGFTDPFGPALVLDLARRGRPVCVADPLIARQIGPRRRCRPGRPVTVLEYRWGPAYEPPPPGVKVLFHERGLGARARARLAAAERGLARHLRSGGLTLTPAMRRGARGHRWMRDLARAAHPRVAPRLAGTTLLAHCVTSGGCDLRHRWNEVAHRLAELRDHDRMRRLVVWTDPGLDGYRRS